MDLPPHNGSVGTKILLISPPPFQPPSLSPPFFNHLRQKYLPCFHGFFKNSSQLRTCASRYNIHSINIKNLLDDCEYHNIYRTSQEKEPLVDTNNHNQITRWSQERLALNHSNHPYTDWELMTACHIWVLSNAYYDQLKSEYGIKK